MIFETERLRVRRYRMEDLDDFYRLNGNPEVMKHIRPPKDYESCRVFLRENIRFYESHPSLGRWAMEEKETDAIAGSFALIPIGASDLLQLGYSLHKEFWGRGLATESLLAGVKYAREVVGLQKVYAITETANPASRRVIEKAGFELEETYVENEKPLLRFGLSLT